MKKFILIVVAGMLWAAVPALAAETLTVVADVWCPFNCAPDAAKPGFGIEILKAIFEPKGITVAYSTLEWEKALSQTAANNYGAVIGGFREDTPGFAVPDEEFGLNVQVAYVKKGNAWKYAGPPSLAGKKVGLIEGYTFGNGIDEYLAAHPAQTVTVTGDNALPALMRKLLLGEVDVVFEDSFVFALKQMELGLADKFQEAGRMEGKPVFVAFAPGRPESKRYAALFTAGIRELRASRKLAGILKNYGIADWKR
jgi:polar amino acid transport system substrate-binding protein